MQERLRWTVIGVGVAGRARAAAIAADPRARLVAVHHGRYAAAVGAPVATSFHEAVEAADVVAIASPTAMHPDQVRSALERGRHVVVEFPLAPDAATAAALFDRARARRRLLHVEHIELLDPPGAALRAAIRPELVSSASVAFQSPGSADASAADLALGNVARLHRLCAAVGPVAAVRAVEHEPGKLTAELALVCGAIARLCFERAPYFGRKTTITVTAGGHTWVQSNGQVQRDGAPVTLAEASPLFAADQLRASARLLDGAPPYVSEARILHVLDVVERLGARHVGPLPQRSDAAPST